jgi:hypothetical protein
VLVLEHSIQQQHFVPWGLSHGKLHMFSHQEDRRMADMVKTPTGFSTTINIR